MGAVHFGWGEAVDGGLCQDGWSRGKSEGGTGITMRGTV